MRIVQSFSCSQEEALLIQQIKKAEGNFSKFVQRAIWEWAGKNAPDRLIVHPNALAGHYTAPRVELQGRCNPYHPDYPLCRQCWESKPSKKLVNLLIDRHRQMAYSERRAKEHLYKQARNTQAFDKAVETLDIQEKILTDYEENINAFWHHHYPIMNQEEQIWRDDDE